MIKSTVFGVVIIATILLIAGSSVYAYIGSQRVDHIINQQVTNGQANQNSTPIMLVALSTNWFHTIPPQFHLATSIFQMGILAK